VIKFRYRKVLLSSTTMAVLPDEATTGLIDGHLVVNMLPE
jgi:hypothetical protein